MKQLLIGLIVILPNLLAAQSKITGTIIDENNQPLPGANIFIKGAYDGASSDSLGRFTFKTKLKGAQKIGVNFLGYEPFLKDINIDSPVIKVELKLKPSSVKLNDLVITAGSFEAGDKKKGVTLKPLDIVTTASASGDIYGAISTLPGTTTIGNDGRLFVRGGDAYECKTYIDGMLVKKPYSSNVPDIPSRGRFSPQLFTGTLFSSGGYSAEYGQALSSALILQTNATAPKTQSGLTLMTVGLGGSHTQAWKTGSLQVSLDYFNLEPYYKVSNQKVNWKSYPQNIGGTMFFHQKIGKEGQLKVLSTISQSGYKLEFPTYIKPGSVNDVELKGFNYYLNATYTQPLNGGLMLKAGTSASIDKSSILPEGGEISENIGSVQNKLSVKKTFSESFSINLGSELQTTNYRQGYDFVNVVDYTSKLDENLAAAFIEAEFMPVKNLALRAGLRAENSSLVKQSKIMPRFSAAYIIKKNSQVSFAYGIFYQTPEYTLLRFNQNLSFERADHYILNYQYTNNDRVFRIETYYKKYSNLVKYVAENNIDPSTYSGNGSGYAKGIDFFFRDQKTIKNLDYWVSYSLIDSKRDWKNYPVSATPTFVAQHNLSVVGKYFVSSIKTQFGASWSFASGRTYYNPNHNNFLSDKTQPYSNLSINCSYLTSLWGKFTIVYTSVNNVLGQDHIYGYKYYSTPDQNGTYGREAINFSSKYFFLLGVFVTI